MDEILTATALTCEQSHLHDHSWTGTWEIALAFLVQHTHHDLFQFALLYW